MRLSGLEYVRELDMRAQAIGNRVVPTNWGPIELNVTSPDPDSEGASLAFTRGQCHSFALALHQETGWPIFGVGHGTDRGSPGHFIVYCADTDDYIDIDGAGADERFRYLFKYGSRIFTAEETRNAVDYLPCFPEVALPFARKVLERHRERGIYREPFGGLVEHAEGQRGYQRLLDKLADIAVF
jgi:hypothetical protein